MQLNHQEAGGEQVGRAKPIGRLALLDGALQAQHAGLNFLGSFSQYGINALYLENYWNSGPPVNETRYLDNLVVSTARVGCTAG